MTQQIKKITGVLIGVLLGVIFALAFVPNSSVILCARPGYNYNPL
jgi:hypothetical protein